MNQSLIIKDHETGRYYTGDYRGFWSRDIEEAALFDDEAFILAHITKSKEEYDGAAFENIKRLEIVNTIKL